LMRDLGTKRCSVRAGEAHDDYDVAVSVGPFVSCRVRTAVAWGWLPRYGMRFRPRRAALAVVAGAAILPLWIWPGLVVIAGVAAAMTIEAVVLYRTVGASLDETSQPATVPVPDRS
jgi:O-antigen biosynthesis protein